jgi:hypothetical protein
MNRDLFALHNARYLFKKELAETFVVTESFKRLLSPKNQIIIGSRGSGKTALLKALSHDHLALLDNDFAREIIANQTYIGIHISTKTKFGGGLRNKDWQNETEKEFHFKWLMNIASCLALLECLKSCLNVYVLDPQERITKEVEIVARIRKFWFPDNNEIVSVDDMALELENTVLLRSLRNQERKMYKIVRDEQPIGLVFELELFDPLVAAVGVIQRILKFPDYTSWFICIDEIEILEEFHHRILNSYMRANMGNIFFKFTTLPYCHYTLDTNLSVPLDVRHDVEYVYIDQDLSFSFRAIPQDSKAYELFLKRAQISKPEYSKYTFHQLFGKSYLLDNEQINYEYFLKYKGKSLSDDDLTKAIQSDRTLTLFVKHANDATRERGLKLLREKKVGKFGSEFGRKIRALVHLKEYHLETVGKSNIELYCGAKTVISVGDSNPRKLIDIFNGMLKLGDNRKAHQFKSPIHTEEPSPVISYVNQNLVLGAIAEREISTYRIERNFGPGLHDFILELGKYMYDHIHEKKLGLEQISSIQINKNIGTVEWKLIERAVQKGLIYPNVNFQNPDFMPTKEGVFHLAFLLAPKFKLLPRKGDSRVLSSIVNFQQLSINFDA